MRIKILAKLENGPAQGSVVTARETHYMMGIMRYQIIDDSSYIGLFINLNDAMPVDDLPPKSINQLVDQAHQNAIDKGWYEEPTTFGEQLANMHSELSEAWEDYRHGRGLTELYFEGDKPCGIPTELADTIIRIFDFCGHVGINLEHAIREKMEYNATRPIRHGGKKL